MIADSDWKIESERRRLFHLSSSMAFSFCFTYRTRQWFDYNNAIFAFPRLIRHRQKGYSQIPPYTELRRITPIFSLCRFRRNYGLKGTWKPSGGFSRASNIHFPIILEFTHQLLNLIAGELRKNQSQILRVAPRREVHVHAWRADASLTCGYTCLVTSMRWCSTRTIRIPWSFGM